MDSIKQREKDRDIERMVYTFHKTKKDVSIMFSIPLEEIEKALKRAKRKN